MLTTIRRLLSLSIVLVVAACAGTAGSTSAPGDQPTTPSQAQQVCDALTSLEMSVEGVRSLDSSSTIDEVRSAVATVGLALQNVQTQAKELAKDKVQGLSDSIDALKSAAQEAAPEASSLAGAAAAVKDEADAVRSAASSLGTELNCPSG